MRTLFLDHDRTPTGITILHDSTFFSREITLPDSLAERMEVILDASSELRARLQRIYEQPDIRIRKAVTETLTEEMIKICDGVVSAEKPKRQDIGATSSAKSRSQQKRLASKSDTNPKNVE